MTQQNDPKVDSKKDQANKKPEHVDPASAEAARRINEKSKRNPQADADAEDLDVSGGTDREANDPDSDIANPNAAKGSASDGDPAT